MNNVAQLILYIIPSLFALAFIVHRYRNAAPLQRRQILAAADGAVILAAAMLLIFMRK